MRLVAPASLALLAFEALPRRIGADAYIQERFSTGDFAYGL